MSDLKVTEDIAAQIADTAAVMRRVDQLSPEELFELGRRLEQFGWPELVDFAGKMLDGRPYRITTDNPALVERYRAIARHFGADERDVVEEGDRLTAVTFLPPPPRQ